MATALKKTDGSLPAFMHEVEDTGTDILMQYVVPPRLKVIQTNARAPFNKFRPGDVIVVPTMEVLAPVKFDSNGKPLEESESFDFIPVFFFPEWVVWNPLEARGQMNAIRDRTLDPKSLIREKATDPNKWTEPCPELAGKFIRFVEHLNFVAMITSDGPFYHVPMIISFSRSEHRVGRLLADLIRLRRDRKTGQKAPIYGCQFSAKVGPRDNAKGHWLGLDVNNPEDESKRFVTDESLFKMMRDQFHEFSDAHNKRILTPDYGDDEADLEPVADSKGEF